MDVSEKVKEEFEKSGFKKIVMTVVATLCLIIIIIGGIAAGVLKMQLRASADSPSGDYSSYTNLGDYIVKTDESNAMAALSKDQLKEVIEGCYSGQEKDNILSVIDDLVSVQDSKKVNAAFMIAVTHIESSGGTNWASINPDTYNWMSVTWGEAWNGAAGKTQVNGSFTWCSYASFNEAIQKFGVYITESPYYFAQNKYTVAEIAPTYCDAAWGDSIKAELDRLYGKIAASLPGSDGGETAAEGDGYTKTYDNGTRTFKLYEQWMGSYSGNSYGGSTISGYGCGPSCVAIILSGYGINKNPGNVVSECQSITNQYGAGTINAVGGYINNYGLKYTHVGSGGYTFTDSDKNKIISHLKAGNPVILLIHSPVVLINGGTASTTDHYVTLLGINSNNEIFVGDPGGSNSDGYATMDSLCNNSRASNYFLVSQ